MKYLTSFLVFLAFGCVICYGQGNADPLDYVDPFIGTEGEGNTFAGATLPFGMVKLGPDSGAKTSNAGYVPGEVVHGFSHTHVSGTGGGPKYGNVLLMPYVGDVSMGQVASLPSNPVATPGFFGVTLKKFGIDVGLTTSHSVGVHRYRFTQPGQRGVMIDAGSHLIAGFCCGESQELVGAEVRIVGTNRVEGYTRVRGGWNKGGAYTVYFSAVFEQPFTDFGVWQGDEIAGGKRTVFDTGAPAGAFVRFPEAMEEVQVKVGISYLSTGKAYANVLREVPGWDFSAVRAAAGDAWRQQLNNISVSGENVDHKTIFYTGLYHALLMPTDRTGENPLWHSSAPYYDDFYAIWDTYRATHPLYMLLAPERQQALRQSLLDIYEHEGYLPDARSGNANGRTQGGSNVDVLFADAAVKGMEGVDFAQALEAMIKNAEIPPGDDHQQKGRGGLLEYNQLGYVSTNHERAGSRTVEYAYNDYCIYLVAKKLGKEDIAAKYLERSRNWRNLWRPVKDHGARGFIMPRAASGAWDDDFRGRAWRGAQGWQPVDFTPHVAGTWPDFFYEAASWEYSFYVPHDVPGLIAASGGEAAFMARLDTFFVNNFYNVGNEPSFLTPSLYNYLGRQDRTNELVRSIIAERFTTAADGIPGNDDSGSMSAWVAFHMLGFYPNAGQDLYLITAPHFPEVTVSLPNDQELRVVAHELSDRNVYIQEVRLNGKPLRRSWFRHTEIMEGGTLEYFMGSQPVNDWEKELPPFNGR